MRPYEVMVIFDPALEEQAIQARVDESTGLISARGGDPGRVERWGKRRLAYEIRHQRDGYYVLMAANAEPDVMNELGRSLLLADDVLRYKVVRIPDKIAAGKAATASPAPTPSPAPPAATGGESVATTEVAEEASTNPNGEQNDG
jgi:small subunit ribosomal protein S6